MQTARCSVANSATTTRLAIGYGASKAMSTAPTSRASQGVVLAPIAGFPGGSAFLTEKENWLASIRGRLGYTWGPGMIYVTGGGTWTGVQTTGGATVFPPAGIAGTFTTSSTRSGYVVGAGYEWMIAPNWALRGEYLYYGFNSGLNGSVTFPGVATVTGNINKFNTSVVRVGLDYELDWGGGSQASFTSKAPGPRPGARQQGSRPHRRLLQGSDLLVAPAVVDLAGRYLGLDIVRKPLALPSPGKGPGARAFGVSIGYRDTHQKGGALS